MSARQRSQEAMLRKIGDEAIAALPPSRANAVIQKAEAALLAERIYRMLRRRVYRDEYCSPECPGHSLMGDDSPVTTKADAIAAIRRLLERRP